MPGVPPIFSVVIAYVAEKEGFFKKYGADVEIRPFDNGTAAARAVVAGDIDMASRRRRRDQPDLQCRCAAGRDLRLPNPDWVIGTPTRQDLQGPHGPGGRRRLDRRRSLGRAARMLTGCPGVSSRTSSRSRSAPTPARDDRGPDQYAVLHLDDLRRSKRKASRSPSCWR